MNQSHPTNPSMKTEILKILSDGRWHGCKDFIHLGLSYRNRISELREEGYAISSEREDGRPTFRYQLMRKKVEPAWVTAPFIDRPKLFQI